jgi:c-di-GMP-binding flagellar brake protein YcgR
VLLRAKVEGAKDDAVFFCTSQNISDSGMLIETDRLLLPGDRLTCSFFLPGAARITAVCEVSRQETSADGRHHCGIRFTDLAPGHKRDIEGFVSGTMMQL